MERDNDVCQLSPCQQQAWQRIESFLRSGDSTFLLDGPAGVGKTFVIQRIVEELVQSGKSVVVVAPTHKAKNVLARTLQCCEVSTVDAFFGLCSVIHPETLKQEFLPPGRWEAVCTATGKVLDRQVPADASRYVWVYRADRDKRSAFLRKLAALDVLVVDEVSMVRDDMAKRILRLLDAHRHIRCVLLGDEAQLPPVGEGVSPLMGAPREPNRWTMRTNKRTADPALIANNDALRSYCGTRTPADVDRLRTGPNFLVVDSLDPYLELFRGEDRVKVLCWTNRACDGYTARIRRLLHGDAAAASDDPFLAGDQVVFNAAFEGTCGTKFSNNTECKVTSVRRSTVHVMPRVALEFWAIGLDVGCTVHAPVDAAAYYRVLYRLMRDIRQTGDVARRAQLMNGKYATLQRYNAPLKHTFAQTVHKSQGESVDVVLVDARDIQRNPNVDEMNRLLYTAVSRARKRVVMRV